jgi:tRNA pseudouridine38-40 synthase
MASVLLGEHDFSAFASAKDISISKSRFVSESAFWYEGERLVYQVAANAFLWRMVRSFVGTLVLLESQASSPEEGVARLKAILDGGLRKDAGPTAPPYGLYLWNVEYGLREHGHPRRRDEEGQDA